MSWSRAAGLSFLYASAYFLPLLTTIKAYFVPSIGCIVYPSVIAVAVLTPAFVFGSRLLSMRPDSRGKFVLQWMALGSFVFIALGSAIAAADYTPTDLFTLISGKGTLDESRRSIIVTVTIGAAIASLTPWVIRFRWSSAFRFLCVLGYAFGLLALARIGTWVAADPAAPARAADTHASSPGLEAAPRRVIWIVFDELDYEETLGNPTPAARERLPNLFRLQEMAVSATHAYSPAKDTAESLPALLTGAPMRGSRQLGAQLLIRHADGTERAFSEPGSIFSRLPGGPPSAALLGYYHPYCRVFPTVGRCQSFYLGNVGRWFDALLFFAEDVTSLVRWLPTMQAGIPAATLSMFDPMFRISQETVRALPTYLEHTDKALVFVHINIPHYPSRYAQWSLNLPATHDAHESYRRNLLLVDRLVGQIETLVRRSTGSESLLVLTSDHWLRINSPQAAQPVPLIAWHAGESRGVVVDETISTVHTGELVLDFLNGRVTTQAQIGAWWRGRPVYPTWIPSNYKY